MGKHQLSPSECPQNRRNVPQIDDLSQIAASANAKTPAAAKEMGDIHKNRGDRQGDIQTDNNYLIIRTLPN